MCSQSQGHEIENENRVAAQQSNASLTGVSPDLSLAAEGQPGWLLPSPRAGSPDWNMHEWGRSGQPEHSSPSPATFWVLPYTTGFLVTMFPLSLQLRPQLRFLCLWLKGVWGVCKNGRATLPLFLCSEELFSVYICREIWGAGTLML